MHTITITGIDDDLTARLKARAEEHGQTIEDEARDIIIAAAIGPAPEYGVGTWARDLAARIGGIELDIPPRTEMPRHAEFGDIER